METSPNPISQKDFIREKHQNIFRQYLTLVRKEKEENPVRAKYISKFYYAEQVACSQTPVMETRYVMVIINRMLRNGEKG